MTDDYLRGKITAKVTVYSDGIKILSLGIEDWEKIQEDVNKILRKKIEQDRRDYARWKKMMSRREGIGL